MQQEQMQQEQLNNTSKNIYFKWARTINTLYLSIEILEMNLIISKIFATGVLFFWNYYGRSKIIFQ